MRRMVELASLEKYVSFLLRSFQAKPIQRHMLMCALNTGRHLEDSFTKGKNDTYLIRVLYSSQAIARWQLMQRVKSSGGLERPAN